MTSIKKTHSLSAALRRAGLARTGAMFALALGAAQAGATTYTVPLTFQITLAAPVCSLTVDTVTADANTPTPSGGVTVNLTPTSVSATAKTSDIVNSLPNTTTFSGHASGLYHNADPAQRRLNSLPTAQAKCTQNTPMTARLTRDTTATNAYISSTMAVGRRGGSASDTLPIGMVMGITQFGTSTNASPTAQNTTWGSYQSQLPDVQLRYAFGTGSAPLSCSGGGTVAIGSPGISASVPSGCRIMAISHLDFGTLSAPLSSTHDQSASVALQCPAGTQWQVDLGSGNHHASARRMASGSGYVAYQLYRNAARTQLWGSTVGGGTVSGTSTGALTTVPIYGRIPIQGGVTTGVYTDTVILTLSY